MLDGKNLHALKSSIWNPSLYLNLNIDQKCQQQICIHLSHSIITPEKEILIKVMLKYNANKIIYQREYKIT